MLYPKPLKQGDCIGLIGLASAAPEGRYAEAVEAVKARGFRVKIYDSCKERFYSYSGKDTLRAANFEEAFCDDEVDGIFCIRGGYGAARALELVNWERVKEAVRRNPKYFSGYSDITAAHLALNQICGLVTWHTPMPSTEYYQPLDEYTERYLAASMGEAPVLSLDNPENQPAAVMVPGKAEGRLAGGNLSLIASTLGTPFELDAKGKILFLEDIGEAAYRIDRMLVQLRQAGKFKDCAGVLLGAWTDCPANPGDMPLEEVLEDIFGSFDKPVLKNVCCGHCLPTMSLPLGAVVQMENDKIRIRERKIR